MAQNTKAGDTLRVFAAPLTGKTVRIYADPSTPSGKNWEYADMPVRGGRA